MIGQTVSHYKITEKLGQGGMGVVYKAQDTRLDRTVALKFLPPHLSTDPTANQRFTREAKAASSLDHPNICTIYDIGETDDGQLFIAMAYYEGQTLKDRLADGLSIEDSVEIAIQIAEGLARAHEAGIVHRDIKPANLMVTGRGRVKILDFGVAKLGSTAVLTKTGSTVGTVAYMSPEQAQGKAVASQTDLWSLGVVLYEMLTGQRPFTGDYEQSVIYSILNVEPESVTTLRKEVPSALDAAVCRALAKNPDERYEHADEMLTHLRQVQQQLEPRPAGAPQITTASGWRKPWYSYAALALVLMISLYMLARTYFSSEDLAVFDSIAVLPLRNLSEDEAQDYDYFVDGLTEALHTELSKIGALHVISLQSSKQYKDTDKSPQEIAEELDVDVLVTGSILRDGERVGITVQLINARIDDALWGERYERDLGDNLRILSGVARAVADQVHVTLTPQEQTRLESTRPVDTEAQDLYLKGRYFFNAYSKPALERSLGYFEQAIDRDPEYALAYAGKARSLQALAFYSSPHEIWPRVKQALENALERDPTLAEAYTVLSQYEYNYRRDWPAVERALKQAIESNPNLAFAHAQYAMFLVSMERHEEAIREIEIVGKLDPVSVDVRFQVEVTWLMMRRYDETIQHALETLRIAPDTWTSQTFLAVAHAMKGEKTQAVAALDEIFQLTDRLSDSPLPPAFLGMGLHAYVVAGEREVAEAWLPELVEIARRQYVCSYEIGLVYVALEDLDEAYRWFDRALKDAAECLPLAQVDPRLESLHGTPRFDAFLKEVGFDP